MLLRGQAACCCSCNHFCPDEHANRFKGLLDASPLAYCFGKVDHIYTHSHGSTAFIAFTIIMRSSFICVLTNSIIGHTVGREVKMAGGIGRRAS